MMEFITDYFWWVFWILITPIVVVCAIGYYTMRMLMNIDLSLEDFSDLDEDFFE